MMHICVTRAQWVNIQLFCSWFVETHPDIASDSPSTRYLLNTLRPRQNGRRFADDTFKCNFLNENVRISIEISLKFVPKGPINNIPALVQIMAWRRSGDKPLSEPMMVSLLTHICVSRRQWVKTILMIILPDSITQLFLSSKYIDHRLNASLNCANKKYKFWNWP